MPLPNFFVIGAPKSGTTALYHCLQQHPDVFMSVVKEPRYFHFGGNPPESVPGPHPAWFFKAAVWRTKDYFQLFAEATHQRAIGEATPDYLRFPEAARRIRDNIPEARLIAVLRQPADRAYSSYVFMCERGIERARTFAEALADEPEGKERGWFSGPYHKTNGFYYEQLRVWYDLFPPEQIKVYLYEDWQQSPQALLSDAFGFLGVDPAFHPVVKRSNVTRLPRSRRLHRLALHPERIEAKLSDVTPGSVRQGAVSFVQWYDRNFNLFVPPPLDPAVRRTLTEEYREDILCLQELIGRDLSGWLSGV